MTTHKFKVNFYEEKYISDDLNIPAPYRQYVDTCMMKSVVLCNP